MCMGPFVSPEGAPKHASSLFQTSTPVSQAEARVPSLVIPGVPSKVGKFGLRLQAPAVTVGILKNPFLPPKKEG